MSNVLEAASQFVSQGWTIFPGEIVDGQKKSHKSEKYSGTKWGATKDAEQVRRDFTKWPDALIGIPTGAVNSVFVIDVDTMSGHDKDGFASLATLEAKHGALPATLMAESPSGSKHYYFRYPGFPVISKPDVFWKGCGIDVRGDGGMVIAPPSVKPDGGVYRWLNALPVAEAPQWILNAVREPERPTSIAPPGPWKRRYEIAPARELYQWLADNNVLEGDDHWRQTGMAARYEFGDDGLELWQIVAHEPLGRTAMSRWNSFDGEGQSRSGKPVTLDTIVQIASRAGWRGQLKTVSQMFGDIVPVIPAPPIAPTSAMPLMGGQQTIAEEGAQIVAAFNLVHASEPHATNAPPLPSEIGAGPLHEPLTSAIGKIVSMADRQRAALKFEEIAGVFGVLALAHAATFEAVVARVRATGAVLPDSRLRKAEITFEAQVRRAMRTGQGWRQNNKGEPDPANADNVAVFLDLINVGTRFNIWTNRAEIRWQGREWVSLTDAELNRLRSIASREEYRFRPSKEFFRDMLQDHARESQFDPVLDRIEGSVWDGRPRLMTWLTHTCGVPCDPYHQAVGRNVIGGIVRRARHPGCQHDEMMLLISPGQGMGKSTLCRILALDPAWHTDSFKFDGSPQNMIPQLFGKLVVECGELAGWSRKDAEDIKSFVSSRSDNFTKKYEAFATDQPRRCIFIGTTNSETPLKDETGNRRFLPVHVQGEVNLEWLRANVEQLIGEAAAREAAGESFAIPREVYADAARHQEAARDLPQSEELLRDWFGSRNDAGHYVKSADIGRAFAMAGLNAGLIRTIGPVMRSLGYKKGTRLRDEDGRGNRWMKGSGDFVCLEPYQTFAGKPVEWRLRTIRTI